MGVDIAALLGALDLAADGAHGLAHGIVAGEKQRWVEVALQHAGANALGGGVHGHAVVHAHDLGAGFGHRL